MFEAEVSHGLESVAQQEIQSSIKTNALTCISGGVRFSSQYKPALQELRTINSLSVVLYFDIPRPKALLGHEHFHRLLDTIRDIRKFENDRFSSFYISAAGSDSSVLQRVRTELASALHIEDGFDNGDLLIRLKRHGKGWEILIRITPRPHATRAWRVCNFEGALNGPVAATMIKLSDPTSEDVVVNLACGSGSLMIERALLKSASKIIGCDIDNDVLACASENIHASELKNIQLIQGDLQYLPLPSLFANQIYADLPFGQLVGSHQENVEQYPHIFAEAARIATPNALFTVMTHEVKLMDKLLKNNADWVTDRVIKISLRGLHPRIYILKKRNGTNEQ